MKAIIMVLRFIWELPQNILGSFLWLSLRHKITKVEVIHNRFFIHIPNFGMSLGSFIYWSKSDNAVILINENNIEHEYGHSIQSIFFGPLYLLIIGLPSILRVLYGSIYYLIKKTKWQKYYKGYPEKWADELGMKYF